jgi:RNA polymerase primary sigma factor
VWWIRQNILHALAEHARMIRLPLNKVALNGRIQRAQSMLEQQLERAPSAEELAESLNMDVEDVMQSISHKDRHVSLDTPLSEDEDTSLLDTLENHNAEKTEKNLCHTESLQTEVARSLKILSERQKETICYFFGIGIEYPMSLEDIAQKLDITPERVRQIKDKAISRLRTLSNFNSLRSFLGN